VELYNYYWQEFANLGLSDWENFRDYLVSLETIPTKVEGRIVEGSDETGNKPGENPGNKPGENPSNKQGENPGNKPGTQANHELPNTATNNFNILLAGLMLVLAGGGLYFVKRRNAISN
jgi:2',3'-cyclic-nucleotide 2'-phosphodiesterase / 3'-nucleotidase / 5'-nucleotidase